MSSATPLWSPEFSFRTRPQIRKQIASEVFDLIIIGGGITGAAVFRDACLRGLKCALIEKEDFASGTSSGSSKLIHGGIRYLEIYDFKLVYHAIRERELLKELYYPFVQDLHFAFPTYAGEFPSRWKLNLGLHLYDSFSFFRERHKNFNRRQALEAFPLLRKDGLTGLCLYSDSFAEDFRLVVELVKSGVREEGLALSRASVKNFLSPKDGLQILKIEDAEGSFEARANSVINCSGPFSDEVRSLLHLPKELRLTQGVHFVLPHSRLPIRTAFVAPDPKLHRILFAIPWNSVTYLGTTDTSIKNTKDARAHHEDVNYVLKIMSRIFATELKRSDVIQSWSGVRPLLEPDTKAKSNSQISREHKIEENPKGVFHILGGKLTSHRLMAEEALDLLVKRLDKKTKSITHELPIHDEFLDKSEPLDHLRKTYGRAKKDIEQISIDRKLHQNRIDNDLPHLEAEVIYSIHHEMALRPIDFLRRRSSLYYERPTREMAGRLCQIFEQEMKWTNAQSSSALEEVLASYDWDQGGY